MNGDNIIIIDAREDPCLSHMEKMNLWSMFGLPDMIPIKNPHYYEEYEEDDSDTDEEEEGRALVMGPHRSTIGFILDHLRKHGMAKKGVPPQYFQENVHPFAREENLDDLYREAFKKVYGYYPEEVRSTDYNMNQEPEYSKRGHIADRDRNIPNAIPIPVTDDDAVMAQVVQGKDELDNTMESIRLAAGGGGEKGSFIDSLLRSRYGRRRRRRRY